MQYTTAPNQKVLYDEYKTHWIYGKLTVIKNPKYKSSAGEKYASCSGAIIGK